ncbi:MAG: TPM domain-containing protein [Candidatus Omnitrophica bacterium]|nr:TPM domain-containing protein [Candidatus Omnitrophota bacterium]
MVERKLHPHRFLSKEEKGKIVEAIRAAEKNTSGEIRIHLDRRTQGDVMDRAKKIFQKQRLHRRKHRNAVLIYLSLADRSFAILGDEGIHQQAGGHFWKGIAESMQDYFSRGQFSEGLERAIHEIGEKLRKHFALSG